MKFFLKVYPSSIKDGTIVAFDKLLNIFDYLKIQTKTLATAMIIVVSIQNENIFSLLSLTHFLWSKLIGIIGFQMRRYNTLHISGVLSI